MIEIAFVVLFASSLWVVARQVIRRHHALPAPPTVEARRALSTLADGGLYRLYAPHAVTKFAAFRNLHLVEGGLAWFDARHQQAHFIDFATIQWVSAITLSATDIASITLHAESQQRWRVLDLQMPRAELSVLLRILQQVIASSRSNIGQMPTHPLGPIPARIAEDTLQGVSQLGAEVGLYLLPPMLIVLQGDQVLAKLDTSSIRRILAVERVSKRLDVFLQATPPEGVIRLYSLYETVAFALPNYRELAQEIAYLSHCPIEFITQMDKRDKA